MNVPEAPVAPEIPAAFGPEAKEPPDRRDSAAKESLAMGPAFSGLMSVGEVELTLVPLVGFGWGC